MIRKEKRTQGERTTKGITLIALVVTIVVLLILAGVTINAVLGDNGIIAQAQKAADGAEEAAKNDEENLKDITDELNSILSGDGEGGSSKPTDPQLETKIRLNKEETTIYVGVSEKLTVTITPDEANSQDVLWESSVPSVATVDKGNVTALTEGETKITAKTTDGSNQVATCDVKVKLVPTTVKEAVESGIVFRKTAKIRDDEPKEMWVPQDFKVVEGESIDTGVVIQDGVGNQFVWVPVPKIEDMYDSVNHAGKLYRFSGTGANVTATAMAYPSPATDDYREPGIVTGNGTECDGAGSNLAIIQQGLTAEAFKSQLQSDFDKMIESVGYYKGFYIGRYETGNLKSGQVTTAVVKKDQEDISNTNWYYMYASSTDVAYKSIDEKITSVTSSMIWGCQWDATLNWFLTSKDQKIKGYVTNSTGMGHYNTTKQLTGTPVGDNKNEVNKIWDMAGNVQERTLELISVKFRVLRGGDYTYSGSDYPVSLRDSSNPVISKDEFGSRVTLYVNK